MANQKIRLTYLWTDESVMHDDFAKKISAGMTDWANEFYRQHGFELDVVPVDRTSVQKAAKFALQKSQGIRPDLRDASEILAHEDALLAELNKKIEEKKKGLKSARQRAKALATQITPILDEIKTARTLMGATPPPDAATLKNLALVIDLASARLDPVLTPLTRANDEVDRLSVDLDKLYAEKLKILKEVLAKLPRSGAYDDDLRVQMNSKFKRDGVGDVKRLSVVFCRVAALLSMRRGKSRTLGITKPMLQDPVYHIPLHVLLWPFPYLIIDIDMGAQLKLGTKFNSTLAHEIVHAAGHDHPDAKDILKVEKRIAGLKFPKPSMLGGRSILDTELEYEYLTQYVTVPGGYLDGPKDDIMNYGLDDNLPASKVKLSDAAKQRLTDAFFVKP